MDVLPLPFDKGLSCILVPNFEPGSFDVEAKEETYSTGTTKSTGDIQYVDLC